jgi:hypothetical protein
MALKTYVEKVKRRLLALQSAADDDRVELTKATNRAFYQKVRLPLAAAGTAGTGFAYSDAAGEATPPGGNVRIKAVYFTVLTTVTANGSNYATLSLIKNDGSTQTTIASSDTSAVDWDGLIPNAMTVTEANAGVADDECVALVMAKTGSGVATPAGSVVIEYEDLDETAS